MIQVLVSRRNLETLLSKMDRVKSGEISACTIIKSGTDAFTNAPRQVMLTAVEDEVLYADRPAGAVLPVDVKEVRHSTGEEFPD